MSNVVSEQVKKFSRWIIAHKEAKLNFFISKLDVAKDDYNLTIGQMASEHKEFLLKVHIRHEIFQCCLIAASIVGSIATILGVIPKFIVV